MALAIGETVVRCSADEVWAVLADFGQISRWAPNVDHSSLTTAQTEGVGMVRRVQVGRNALLETVTEWKPNEALAYTIEGLPNFLGVVTNRWEIVPIGSSTSIGLTVNIDAGERPPQKLIANIATRPFGKVVRKMVDGLEHYLGHTDAESQEDNQ